MIHHIESTFCIAIYGTPTLRKSYFVCFRSKANGNCLFNSCSISMVGDQSLHGPLRIFSCIELFQNARFYSYHPRLDEAWNELNHSDFDSYNSVFGVSISDDALLLPYDRDLDNREECLKYEAEIMSYFGRDASFACICALSSIPEIKICSYYSKYGGKGVKKLLNCEIIPRGSIKRNEIFHFLWSRAGNFYNRPGVLFSPNHFVPMFLVSEKHCGSSTEMKPKDKKLKLSQPKITKKFQNSPIGRVSSAPTPTCSSSPTFHFFCL